jgi:hypothetical protein
MSDGGPVRLTLPLDRRFRSVANLVLGGIALRGDLSLEALEDLQLALGAVLDRAGGEDRVTVELALAERSIVVRVGPLALAGGLERPQRGLDLHRVLSALVDEVELEGDWIRLSKATAAGVPPRPGVPSGP